MRPLERICIWGTSVKKVGDEAQLASILTFFRKRFPGVEVTVFSQLREAVLDLMTQLECPGQVCALRDLTQVYEQLQQADALVIIGGPFFEDKRQMASLAALIGMARMMRKPVMTFGATLFGIKTASGRQFYKRLYRQIDVISARDDNAQQVLDDLGTGRKVMPLTDPRYNLQPAPPERVREILIQEGLDPDRPYVAITTRHLHEGMPDWVKEQMGYTPEVAKQSFQTLAAFMRVLSTDYQLVIIPMHPSFTEDKETAGLWFRELPAGAFLLQARYSPLEVVGIMKGAAGGIQSRVGSTVFSVLAGSPFLAVSYESRMQDWMAANGLGEFCVDWKAVEQPALQESFAALQVRSPAIRGQFEETLSERRRLFAEQAEEILQALWLARPWPSG